MTKNRQELKVLCETINARSNFWKVSVICHGRMVQVKANDMTLADYILSGEAIKLLEGINLGLQMTEPF